MINRNSVIAIFLTYLLCLSLLPNPVAYAADNQPEFSFFVSKKSQKINEQFQVEVKAAHLTDLYAYELNLTYDSSRLSFVKEEQASGGFSISPLVKGNTIQLAHTQIGNTLGQDGPAILATLTFTTIAQGEAEISLESLKLVNSQLVATEVTGTDKVSIHIQNTTQKGNGNANGSGNGVGNGSGGGYSELRGDTIFVTSTVEAAGKLRAEVKELLIQQAILKVQAKTITIEVQGIEGRQATSTEVVVPIQSIIQAGQSNVQMLKFKLGEVTVAIATEESSGIFSNKSREFKLSVEKVDPSTLPNEVQAMVQGYPIYEFSLSVDGEKIGQFRSERAVTIWMNYTPKPDEKVHEIVIYYMDDDGKLEVVKNAKADNKTNTILFRPKHFSRYAAANAEITFDDLSEAAWAQVQIESMAAREMVQGVGKGHFAPNRSITRAEFVQMLISALDLSKELKTSKFKDVSSTMWYYDALSSAESLGIVTGISNGKFGGGKTLTREQMTTMVYRAAKAAGKLKVNREIPHLFTDADSVAGYAQEAVNTLQQTGVIQGLSNGQFQPKKLATRAQAALVIYNLLETLD